jgi:hypothetical protein
MLLLIRKILFYILLLCYLVLTPYIILYGLGYSVDPTEGEIYKTGLLSVVTEPRGATIYLEDKKYSGKTPAAITGLLPGQYTVKLALKGFEWWQKTIEIIPEKATRLEPVVMLPRRSEAEKVVQGTYQDLFPKNSDFKIFARQGETLNDLYKIDLFFKNETSVLSGKKGVPDVRILNDKSDSESSSVLFRVENQGRMEWMLVDLEREKITADLTSLVPDKVDLIEWDSKNPDYFYFLKNGELTVADIEQHKFVPVGAGNVIGVGARQKRLYFLKNDLTLWQANAQGENPVQLTEKDGIDPKVFPISKSNYYQIQLLKRVLFQRDLFLFLGDNGALMSNWPPYQLVEKDVKEYLHSIKGDSEKILYWTAREIGMFDFALKDEEDEAFPPRTLLYRSGINIRQAFWAYDHTHVLFVDQDEVFFLEASETAPYLVRNLGRIEPDTRISYNDRQHAFYYLSPGDRKIMKRKISE